MPASWWRSSGWPQWSVLRSDGSPTATSHRAVLSLGVLAMSLAFAAYALSAERTALYALEALLMGLRVAAVNSIGPALIVGARLPASLEARRLSAYDLISPVGQLPGGLALAAVALAGWSVPARFWLASAALAAIAAITWCSGREPTEQLHAAMQEPTADPAGETDHAMRQPNLRRLLLSTFGLHVLILVLSSVAYDGIINQISNILPNVYGISAARTAGLISLAGLLNIGVYLVGGRWMGRAGLAPVLVTGHAMRLIGALGMALLGLAADAPELLVIASMQILDQALPFVRLGQPVGAVRYSTVAAGEASGWVIGASAVGSFIGGMSGGFLADAAGFNSTNWMATISAGLAAG